MFCTKETNALRMHARHAARYPGHPPPFTNTEWCAAPSASSLRMYILTDFETVLGWPIIAAAKCQGVITKTIVHVGLVELTTAGSRVPISVRN